MFCFTTKKPLTVFYGVEMMLLGRLKCRRRWRRRKPQKCNGLRLAKQQLCQVQHTFWCISLLALHLYDVKLPNLTLTSTTEKNQRRPSLFFRLLNLNIIITNSTPGGFVFIWLRPRSHLFFFSVFEKKNTRIHVAYWNRFRPSLPSQSRRRFRSPLVERHKSGGNTIAW